MQMVPCGVTSPSTSSIVFMRMGLWDQMGLRPSVSLKKTHTLPSIDEKLGEEEGSPREKNDAMALCRKYARTRPDISACLGLLAPLAARRPKQVKAHLVDLWRCLWTTVSHAMCTLPSPKVSQTLLQKYGVPRNVSGAQGGPKTWDDSLKMQTYCNASFAPGGGRSRSGILIWLVDEATTAAGNCLGVTGAF